MNNYLKKFRQEKLKMTCAELAKLINVDEKKLALAEENPESAPMYILELITEKTGISLNELVSYNAQPSEPLAVKDTWQTIERLKRSTIEYLTKNDFGISNSNSTENMLSYFKDEAIMLTKNMLRKPTLVFIGRSDSGKSTIINSIIGKLVMPTNWTPTTSISITIKSIDDKPNHIENELVIFKKDDFDEEFDIDKIDDEEYLNKWKIAEGDAELLASYGTHQGESYSVDRVGSAVIYIDSPILKVCDIMDIPGFAAGNNDDNSKAIKAKSKADILVYTSQSNGFLIDANDFVQLKSAMNYLPIIAKEMTNGMDSFSNLFVVATQSDIIDYGNRDSLDIILNAGSDRFIKTLHPSVWKDGAISEDFKKRFFTYSTKIDDLRKRFEQELILTLEALPLIIEKSFKDKMTSLINEAENACDKESEHYKKLSEEYEYFERLVKDIQENEPNRRAYMDKKHREVLNEIEKCNEESKRKFKFAYNCVLSKQHIINKIKSANLKCKKADIQVLASLIHSELENELQEVIAEESKELSEKIDAYIHDFDNNMKFNYSGKLTSSLINFNAKRAFAAGLSGLATFGGLAFWASTCGNLGGYIIIAKGVSLLSSIGISVGGTATATAAIATIGGPVTLGIALAVISAICAFAIVSGSWKNSVAKQLAKAYDDKKAFDNYCECIFEYWNNTRIEFTEAATSLEKGWETYFSELLNQLDNYDIDEFKKRIDSCEKAKDYFHKINAHDTLQN